jgi:hypothetical protein
MSEPRNLTLDQYKLVERHFLTEYPTATPEEHRFRMMDYMEYRIEAEIPEIEAALPVETVALAEVLIESAVEASDEE